MDAVQLQKSLEAFKEFMTLKNFSPRTIKTYFQIVDYFQQWSMNHYTAEEMSDDIVNKNNPSHIEK